MDRKQLSAALEEILEATRACCWGSGRRDKGKGDRGVADSDAVIYGPWYDGIYTGAARVVK